MAFELALSSKTPEEWSEREIERQVNKALANALGDFHQALIGELPGWKSTGATGGLFDLIHENPFGSRGRPVIGEVKNKFNTLNAGGQRNTYDTFQNILNMPNYKGYDCYLIQVVQKRPSGDVVWFPSQRGRREDIRMIGAQELYSLSTGNTRAFQDFFAAICAVLDARTDMVDALSVGVLWGLFKSVYHYAA